MKKAIFLDFYGTVVFEDGENIRKISQIIFDTGEVDEISEIGAYWWDEFYRMFVNAYGENFRTQRDIELQSLTKTIEHFKSSADAEKLSNEMFDYWRQPPIFEESKKFFEQSPVPIYIVSNIDTADIKVAIEFHGLKPEGVFTSEDAKSYKPRKELFEYALKFTGLMPEEVVHIGDSMSSDVKGASALGIDTIWVNRSKRSVPERVCAVESLLEVFNTEFFK
ncbi:MAG: HAD family hydrolase [Lachnospiraceae bacterium]|nr:HAD family hydrolase [Lachnospiraceae bacterium]